MDRPISNMQKIPNRYGLGPDDARKLWLEEDIPRLVEQGKVVPVKIYPDDPLLKKKT